MLIVALKWNDSVQLQFCVFILGVFCSSYAWFTDQHDLLFCYWALVQRLSSSVLQLVPLMRSSFLLFACPLAGFTTVPVGNLIVWLNFLSKKRQGHSTNAPYRWTKSTFWEKCIDGLHTVCVCWQKEPLKHWGCQVMFKSLVDLIVFMLRSLVRLCLVVESLKHQSNKII